ncbi:TetR/AcrR family transcriptional regulator [Levilactobacillus brevis]|nr:TetR/AcrR family transcriptional regulator [Levilactobacillus brevis]
MTDLRIKKTDAIISTSFVDLVLEKGFDNVTVKDIASRSMINRKTFYAHYEDKFALTDKIGQDILNWFTKALQKRASLLNQVCDSKQCYQQNRTGT